LSSILITRLFHFLAFLLVRELTMVERRINTLASQQCCVVSLFHDSSILHNADQICISDGTQPVSNHHSRAAVQ
jgi:hypothetical protein